MHTSLINLDIVTSLSQSKFHFSYNTLSDSVSFLSLQTFKRAATTVDLIKFTLFLILHSFKSSY